MRYLTAAGRRFLIGSDVAWLLMDYAALIAQIKGGDTIDIRAIESDGNEVVATLLLNSGSAMVTEAVSSEAVEPENAALERYLRERLASYNDARDIGNLGDDAF